MINLSVLQADIGSPLTIVRNNKVHAVGVISEVYREQVNTPIMIVELYKFQKWINNKCLYSKYSVEAKYDLNDAEILPVEKAEGSLKKMRKTTN